MANQVAGSQPAWAAKSKGPQSSPIFRLLDACTIFLSSLLLFLVQPMMAKALLPWFGGSAGVWTSAMFFFQAVLLLGYCYADFTSRHLTASRQGVLHIVLLAASLALLPIRPLNASKAGAGGAPIAHILLLLGVSVGLPCLLLSATSPLVQVWYTRRRASAHPYRLFAVSNLASLAALLMYPVAIEPLVSTPHQLIVWSVCYAVFVLLTGIEAFTARGKFESPTYARSPLPLRGKLLWFALAACPSALWLGTANALSQEVAPIPLLWIVPLSVYLLSLILCFHREDWYRPGVARVVFPVGWLALVYCVGRQAESMGFAWTAMLFCGSLFVCCMFCHGELARRKPPAEHLTTFYLTIALGGAAGGLFVGILAPAIFTGFTELPVAVTGCGILGLALLFGVSSPRRLVRLGLTAAAGLLFATWLAGSLAHERVRVRNFYGALQVSEAGAGSSALRILNNGAIDHGAQFLSPEKERLPTTYYAPDSGVGLALRALAERPVRVGVIGLGTGTLACYARRGDFYRFYEINPAVIQIAKSEFRYLSESAGHVDVVSGDGRLALEREPRQNFDLLALDAFSGDSVPVHLLTREAFRVYFSQLKPDGVLAVNITNRYLDLSPVVYRLAQDAGIPSLLVRNPEDPSRKIFEATWAIVTKNSQVLREIAPASIPFPSNRSPRTWTDDYTSLFEVLR